ncbi:uncharacterized protein SONE68_0183 [Lacticaseibacillus paracasei]|nr:uncharacterized protein SONE68_0183 [Lacticaseibacillus paracasei]GEK39880.1 hypothetical protein LCA02_15700 [Lacticaseibacillus casei]
MAADTATLADAAASFEELADDSLACVGFSTLADALALDAVACVVFC